MLQESTSAALGFSSGSLNCVNVNKIIFGGGTKLHVAASKFNLILRLFGVISVHMIKYITYINV